MRPWIPVLLAIVACAGGPDESGHRGIGEPPDCDPATDGCWPDHDRVRLLRVLAALREPSARCDAASELALLDHKLHVDERARLAELGQALCADRGGPHDPAWRALAAPLLRLEEDLVRTRMASVTAAIEGLASSSACTTAGVACAHVPDVPPLPSPAGWPDGVRIAVDEVAAGGVLGRLVAAIFASTGVLDRDWEADNALLWGSEAGTLSLEARVDRILAHAEGQSLRAGALTGLETMLPFAGPAASILHEQWWMLSIHLEMALRIAAAHGWDLTDGAVVIAVLSIVMQNGLLPEGTDLVVASVEARVLERKAEERFAVWTGGRISSLTLTASARWIRAWLARRSGEVVTRQVVSRGTGAVARQLLGWAGAWVIVGAAGNWAMTALLGRRAAHTTRLWLGELDRDGSTFLADPGVREDAFASWSAMALADGALDEREASLYAALVERPIWLDEQTSERPSPDEVGARAVALAEARDVAAVLDAPARCARSFGDADGRERRTLLAWSFALAAIDGSVEPGERALQDQLAGTLEAGLWDPLDRSLLTQIERTIGAEVAQPSSELGLELGLTLEDVAPALRVSGPTRDAFRAAGVAVP